jgi:glycosyltransferase involved in cell wall biosynthesis
MSRIAILSPSLAHGDAVTNDVFGMAEVLKQRGYDVRLFCESHALHNGKVFNVTRLRSFLAGPRDTLIYHFSHGWRPALDLLATLACKKVIKYHNITPAHFFEGFSSSDVELCKSGREQLAEVIRAGNVDLFLSASAFNMRELIALGAAAEKNFVVPPFHRIDRLTNLSIDDQVVAKYSDGHTNVLSVSRVAPHKGHLNLLEAFAQFHFNCNGNSRLLVVGKGGEGLSPYSQLLHRATEMLGLRNAVTFTGAVSEEALRAYYQVADVFVTTSEHEGFCVPLVEAMSMELPIAAYASSAIPETLGDAGVAWAERDPFLIAETLDVLTSDATVRETLAARALRRYRQNFTQEAIERSFFTALSWAQ